MKINGKAHCLFEQLNGARVIEKNMRTGTEKIIKERL